MPSQFTIGLDYGTNSVRALIVDTSDGREVASSVWNYEHGQAGVILSRDPNLARQHPADYIKGAEITIKKALADAPGVYQNLIGTVLNKVNINKLGRYDAHRGKYYRNKHYARYGYGE